MSTAQMRASQQFLDAMGTMVDKEENVARVVKFISLMKEEQCPTISDEEFAKLMPVDEMFAGLRRGVHEYYNKEIVG